MFPANAQILIVDDMLTMRKIVQRACREIGFSHFVEAADGAFGWEALNAAGTNITLVISDWNMPNCMGIDLLKRVRNDSRFKNLPFLLLTAESEKTQVLEAVQAGVSGYVIKPFTVENLKAKLADAYKKHFGGG
jgi:two-component system chemotaxis response regulator CheY